jgi:putative hydrolase of the HAD superfamily
MALFAHAAHRASAIIFDGDDTLWSTEQLYDNARLRAQRVIAECGLDPAKWEVRERWIDVQNVANFGYSPGRFPTSCVQAYEEICDADGRGIDPFVVERIRKAAQSAFEGDPPLVSGARETLLLLRSKGVRLALLTKGDSNLQSRKIERSGLADLFDVIKIVPEKSPAIILEVVNALGAEPRSTWMVGNSIRSDVQPAIDAGLRAVWINAHVWEYEKAYGPPPVVGMIEAAKLGEVPALIQT